MSGAITVEEMEDRLFWLLFQSLNGLIDLDKLTRAYDEFGTLKPVWLYPKEHLPKLGVAQADLEKFLKRRTTVDLNELKRDVELASDLGCDMVRCVDDDYPKKLLSMPGPRPGPPLVLYLRGSLREFGVCVAISGTRNCSLQARKMARSMANDLARAGFTVVSGLARGVDEFAHVGTLEAPQGRTIAVLPWIRPTYPSEHEELLEDIMESGVAISENIRNRFGRGAKAKFVERNRIISGLSECLIAIESGEDGGTVRQVEFALGQGRPVFTLRPPKSNERAYLGFQHFVKLGAVPVSSTRDVIRFLESQGDTRLDRYLRTARSILEYQ